MKTNREYTEAQFFAYLDELKADGETNMLAAPAYLAAVFSLPKAEAVKVARAWAKKRAAPVKGKARQFSAKFVEKVREPGRYHDTESRGLYLQVGPTGTKSWLLRYEYQGRERWHGLGRADDFSLKEARQRARAKRQLLADGIDPIDAMIAAKDAAAREARERQTFKEAAEEFLRLHAKGWRNDKHRKQWRSSLAEHAFPKLGDRAVATIDTAMINETVAAIWTKTPETARRVRGRIERIVQWVKNGKPLPSQGVSKRVKHHAAMPYVQLPGFVAELRKRNSISAKALEFALLTVARTGEVIGATWDEIDFDKKLWTVPAERMKSAHEHRVPLTQRAIALLNTLPREDGNRHLFIGGRKGEGLSNMAMAKLLKTIDDNGYTVHGTVRSGFADWCAEETNFARDITEAALAHRIKDKTQAAYERGDKLKKRRVLMAAWTRYLDKPLASDATVIPMKRRVAA